VTRIRRLAVPLAAAAAALSLIVAGPAAARGGGSTTPPPPDTTFVDVCEGYWDMPAWPDGSLPVVNRTNGGCVIVRHYLTGVNRLSRWSSCPAGPTR
jgi:hypothetical protein